MKRTIERITRTAMLAVAFILCATTSAWAAAKPVAIWHRDFTVDTRGGYGITANGNTVGTEYITLNGTSGGVIVKNTSVTQDLEHYPLGVVARFTGAVNSSSIRALATTITSATSAGSDRTWFGVGNSTQMQSYYYNNGSPAAWTGNRNNYDANHAWPNTGTHYFGCTYSAEDKDGSSGRFGWRSYVDGVLSMWNNGMFSYSTDKGLYGYGFALGGSTTGYQFTDATIDYIAIVRSAYPSDIAYWSLTDMTKTAATFAGSDANTGVNVPASGETISAATAAAAVFVQADATLGFSGSGSLTIGDGTGPLYIDSAATLTIDLNGVTAPTAESPFVLLVKGQVYGAAQVNFTNVPSDVITSIGEGGTIALLHNSVYTDLLASWKSNGQKVFAWRDATGNAFQSCNVSSVDTDTGTIGEATATTHSYSKNGGFNDENPAGVLYYDNPAYASSTSVNYSWFTLGGLFVTAGGSSLGNASQQLKLGDNRSNSGRTFHYVFAQSFDLGPFKSDSKLYGPVDLTIYEGATVTLSANGLKLANDSGMVAKLKMSGGGVLKTSGTITAETGSNGITLDYSALDVSRTEPFIQGNLSIHDNVNLVLPAALAANTPYQLCSSTLTVGSTSLQKSITVGTNTFLADLTFDTSAKTVSYCPARTTTVSGGTAEWSSLTWANGTGTAGWASGANAHITVSAESTISVGSATTVNKLKLLGSANLTITGIDNLTVGSFDLSDYTGNLTLSVDNAATATTWKFTGSAGVTVVSSANLTLGTLDLSEYSGSMVVDGPTTSPVAAENALSITTSASLGSSASLTISHNALVLANGVLTGAGTLYLDPGEGNSYTMSQSNTGYTGEAVIKSGTVKMGDATSFGNIGRDNYYIRVKGDATFDVNHHDATSAAYSSRKNQVVLEEGAKLTSSTAQDNNDTKLSGFQTIKLDGDAEVVADTTYVALSLHYNYWPSRLELGTHTLTKKGANQLYLSICTITGTGMLDIEEGGVTILNGYNGSLSTCENGTIRIGSGGRLDFSQYSSGAPTLSVKNLELYGSVTRVADSSTLTVTGYISGTGTTPMLTLADGATLKPLSSTGGLTVTSSLTLSGHINVDLSEIDLTGKSKLAIITSPLQIDKDTQVETFTRGSNSEDWVLYSEEVSTGVYELGVKLNKEIADSISWDGASGTWSAIDFNSMEDTFYNDANQTIVFADDAGSSVDPLAITVSGAKTVNAVNFTADNRNVTLSGNSISADTVSKSGDGVATVNCDLSVTTSISVTDGVLVLNPTEAVVSDEWTSSDNGTLVVYVGSGETTTLPAITATTLIKRGAGELVVGDSSDIAGNVIIESGTLTDTAGKVLNIGDSLTVKTGTELNINGEVRLNKNPGSTVTAVMILESGATCVVGGNLFAYKSEYVSFTINGSVTVNGNFYSLGDISVGSTGAITVGSSGGVAALWHISNSGTITLPALANLKKYDNNHDQTKITNSSTGKVVFNLTANMDVRATDLTTYFAGSGKIVLNGNVWCGFSRTGQWASTIAVENNLKTTSGGFVFPRTSTIGTLSGDGLIRADLDTGASDPADRVITVVQAANSEWSGTLYKVKDKMGTFAVSSAKGATKKTLTLSGTQQSGDNYTGTGKPLVVNAASETTDAGSVNLTGTWVGDATVDGEFGGTGSITGALTLNAGSTFKVWATGGLTVTGALTLPASGTVAVDVSDLTIGAGDSTTLLTVDSGMPANVNKFALDSATHMLSISGQTLSLVPIAATLTSNGVTTPYATVDQAVAFLANPLLPGDSYVTLVHGTTSDLSYNDEQLTACNIVYNSANGRYVLAEEAKIDTVPYPTIEAAIAVAGESDVVELARDVARGVAVNSEIKFSEGSYTFTGFFTGSGTIVLGAALKAPSADRWAAGWTGTVELKDITTVITGFDFAHYGNANSTVRANNVLVRMPETSGEYGNVGTIEVATGGLKFGGDPIENANFTFAAAITGTGTIGVGTRCETGSKRMSQYIFTGSMSGFAGGVDYNNSGDYKATIVFKAGNDEIPQRDTDQWGQILVSENTTLKLSKEMYGPAGIVLAGTINVLEGGSIRVDSPSGKQIKGSGTINYTTFPSSAPKFNNAWTGTVKLPAITSGAIIFNNYGTTGSTVYLTSMSPGAWIKADNATINPKLYLAGNMTLSAMSETTYTFAEIDGPGALSFASSSGSQPTAINITKVAEGYSGTISSTLTTPVAIGKRNLSTLPACDDKVLAVGGTGTISLDVSKIKFGVNEESLPAKYKLERRHVGEEGDGFYVYYNGTIFSVW